MTYRHVNVPLGVVMYSSDTTRFDPSKGKPGRDVLGFALHCIFPQSLSLKENITECWQRTQTK